MSFKHVSRHRYTGLAVKVNNRCSFLIVGLGSIGRRHLLNLRTLGQEDIILCRSGKSTLPDDELAEYQTVYDLDTALAYQPTAVIVANPTALHMPVALKAARSGSHLLLEKPISHTVDGVTELEREVEQRGLCALVGFQFRFHPALQQVKRWLDEDAIGEVVSVNVGWGEYLPDWHPWEDYRYSYSAQPDLGGGVLLTLCHPFDYLRWLLGEIDAVYADTGTRGGLGIDVEDFAQVTIRFSSGAIGSVYLDYIARPPFHSLRIIGRNGTIRWNNKDGTAYLNRANRALDVFTPPPSFERNTLFLEEMGHFLRCLENGEMPACTLQDGFRVLELVLAAKQSSRERKEISLR